MANLTTDDLISIRSLPAATLIQGTDVIPLGQLVEGAESDRGGTVQQLLDLLGSGGGGGNGGSAAISPNHFEKLDLFTPAFIKDGPGSLSVKVGTVIRVAQTTITVSTNTPINTPPFIAGSDYSIFACADSTFHASDPGAAPEGYLPEEVREIGGFHYAPGGNATAYNTGGNSDPEINEYSFWDLKFRPSCPNPKGMTFVPLGRFWTDIYPACRNPEARGSTSSYGGTIADGTSSATWPVNPAILGGNGSITYPDAAGYNLMEFVSAYGKTLATTNQFRNAAYGVVENQSRGTNWTTATLVPASTSKWGVMMATGCGFQFGCEYSVDANFYQTAAYGNTAGGRGKIWSYNTGAGITQLMHGGGAFNGANSGSRCTHYLWNPNTNTQGVGARGYAKH
jgi:hypothetical protein